MNLIIVPGMFFCSSFLISVCMFIVSKVLLISSATVIVRAGGAIWLNPFARVLFTACRSCGPAGWLALLLKKAGDVEINTGPTTLNKRVWICDICHKQIHVRKQICTRCNRIEHWVHLRRAGIRQAQYTDTWACHLYR